MVSTDFNIHQLKAQISVMIRRIVSTELYPIRTFLIYFYHHHHGHVERVFFQKTIEGTPLASSLRTGVFCKKRI